MVVGGLPREVTLSDDARSGDGHDPEVILVVDVANVVGSRPDGWWRDRAGAASRLLESLAGLRGTEVTHPGGVGAVRIADVVAVLEGAARSATAPETVTVASAPRDGDSEVVAQARRVLDDGETPLVVTADRGLRKRLPSGSLVVGPGWLNKLVGR
jgi:hypothetical protein